MTCRITLADESTNQVVLEGIREQAVNYTRVEGGGYLQRFLDGHSELINRWRKWRLAVTGLDYKSWDLMNILQWDTDQITVTVETGQGSFVYVCHSLGPSENWDMTGGEVSWDLQLEEV